MVIAIVAGPWFASKTASSLFIAALDPYIFSWSELRPSVEPDGKLSGRHSEGVTPVPIPNTAVKPLSADGTVPDGGTGE
jgi:hypothetical protein